jgi:hypothetical protein
MIQSPAGESFTEEEAHTMCKECDGSLAAYGQLDLWDELKLAHAGKPSTHKVAKKAKKDADPKSQ